TRSPMGRCLIRGLPSSLNVPFPSVHKADRNRMLVPLFSSHRSADDAGSVPPAPWIRMLPASRFRSTGMPNLARLSSITCVSTLSRTPERLDWPAAIAPTIKARLVRLLDPGGRIRPKSGRVKGVMGYGSCIGGPSTADRHSLRPVWKWFSYRILALGDEDCTEPPRLKFTR